MARVPAGIARPRLRATREMPPGAYPQHVVAHGNVRLLVFAPLDHCLTIHFKFLRDERKDIVPRVPGVTHERFPPAALQFHFSERVTAMVNTDEPGLFSAEVPSGPIRSNETIA